MPRVRLTEAERYYSLICDNLKKLEQGRSAREMAIITGVSEKTYYNRRKNPKSLTLQEVYRLCTAAKINIADFYSSELKLKGE
jgi:uncharacterized protein (DUF2384 family)